MGEGLGDDMGVSGTMWTEDMYPASGLAVAAAYHDIKTRLAGLERENHTLRMMVEFEEKRNHRCSFEPVVKETSLIQSEITTLQQRINCLTQELQQSKDREQRLLEVIQAYEKIHLEKKNVQRDLDKMTSLAEQHAERIRTLESSVRQRDSSLSKLTTQLHNNNNNTHNKHLQHSNTQLHISLNVPREGRGLHSSRSLDALSDLRLQRLEAELEDARRRAEGACRREEGLRAELGGLRQEVTRLQEERRTQEVSLRCEHCDVEWIKKAGDEQVNLALAYTELTEELGRVRSLMAKQSELLQHTSKFPPPPPPPLPQHLSPTKPPNPPHPSHSVDRLLPSPGDGPASFSHQPTSKRLRQRFQGRRSYSEVLDPTAFHRPPARLLREPVSTLPKPGGYGHAHSRPPLRSSSLLGLARPASAHAPGTGGGGGGRRRGGSSLNSSPHHAVPLTHNMVHHFSRHDNHPEPGPLVTPPQSDDEEEWVCPSLTSSPPRTLGSVVIGSPSPRAPPPLAHPSFSAPDGPTPLACPLPPRLSTEHAQSWPSINLWMETDPVRSCPLCQLSFPSGYPDDALIRHIDSHLENSKI